MSGCQSCNSCMGCMGCQDCVSCQSCNTCQLCVRCEGTCNTSQAFCTVGSQLVSSHLGSFDFNTSFSTDSLFFSKANWNKIFTYIRDAYNYGGAGRLSTSLPSSDPNDFMTADMFNQVAGELSRLGSTASINRVSGGSEGTIVYGSYFQNLENYANNTFRLNRSQCQSCNSDCNVDCDNCQRCNSCQLCVSRCQGCDSSQNNSSPQNCCSSCNVGCESYSPPPST